MDGLEWIRLLGGEGITTISEEGLTHANMEHGIIEKAEDTLIQCKDKTCENGLILK